MNSEQPIADVTKNPIDDAGPAIPENSRKNIEDQIAKQTGYVNEDALFPSGVHPDDFKAFEKPGSEFITFVSLPDLGLSNASVGPFVAPSKTEILGPGAPSSQPSPRIKEPHVSSRAELEADRPQLARHGCDWRIEQSGFAKP